MITASRALQKRSSVDWTIPLNLFLLYTIYYVAYIDDDDDDDKMMTMTINVHIRFHFLFVLDVNVTTNFLHA